MQLHLARLQVSSKLQFMIVLVLMPQLPMLLSQTLSTMSEQVLLKKLTNQRSLVFTMLFALRQ